MEELSGETNTGSTYRNTMALRTDDTFHAGALTHSHSHAPHILTTVTFVLSRVNSAESEFAPYSRLLHP